MVPEAKKVKRVPSVARLASEARPIVCDAMDDNYTITITKWNLDNYVRR